jgi:hypothetical protein
MADNNMDVDQVTSAPLDADYDEMEDFPANNATANTPPISPHVGVADDDADNDEQDQQQPGQRSMQQLTSDVEQMRTRALAAGTRTQYTNNINRFEQWCDNRSVAHLQLHEDLPSIICLYLQDRYMSKSNLPAYTTLEGQHAAIKHKFSQNYGPWTVDALGGCRGNPCDSVLVKTYMRGAERTLREKPIKSSRAMSLEDMNKLHVAFNNVVENNGVGQNLLASYPASLMYDALFSLSWYCWFRIDEALGLKFKDVTRNVVNSGSQRKYHKISITFRKTNQTSRNKTTSYNIYEATDGEESADAFMKLERWIIYLEEQGFSTSSEKNIFRDVDGNSIEASVVSNDKVNARLNEFALKVGIISNPSIQKLSTHCFRRGGAQHRFFFTKKPWSLTSVRAWGGWTRGETVDTIVRYLMNEYQVREEDFSDMMNPERRDRNLSVMNFDENDDEQTPVEQQVSDLRVEFRQYKTELADQLKHGNHLLQQLVRSQSRIQNVQNLPAIVQPREPSLSSSSSYVAPQNTQLRHSARVSAQASAQQQASQTPNANVEQDHPQQSAASSSSNNQQHNNRTSSNRRRGRPRVPIDPRRAVFAIPNAKTFKELCKYWYVGDDDTPALRTWSKEQVNHVAHGRQSRKANYSKRKRIFDVLESMPRDQFEDVFQQHLQPFSISGLYASVSRYDENDFAVLESNHPDREERFEEEKNLAED